MKIIIFSPSYDPGSGGIIVLHKLCDLLIQQGFDAGFYIENEFIVNTAYNYNVIYKTDINFKNDIVVYPEIINGNPLGVSNVVRYILNKGHVTLNRKDTWGENDYWIYFSKRFYDKIKPPTYLHISDSKLDLYKDYNLPRTYKECFTYRKYHDKISELDIMHSSDAIEIGFNLPDETLISIFNICERFYCYDPESHLSVLASICGCDSIIVPNNKFDRDTIINNSDCFSKGGIAYGTKEIEQARETKHHLLDFLHQKEKLQSIEVKQIFTKIIKYFNL